MSSRIAGAWIRQLDLLLNRGSAIGLEEGQLLDRFVARNDEAAFASLVARHGPMVLGVCRRLLHDEHDVEDAFQATFLVLVRRARGIRNGDLVGHWLHGVAHRVAVRARAQAARRHVYECHGLEDLPERLPKAGTQLEKSETLSVIDEELLRLPESLRIPMVLCYLEGLTHDEAANKLRWPVGTVRSRMARARSLLRERLQRRGVGGCLSLPMISLRRELVPPALLRTTVKASSAFGLPKAASTALLSSTASALATGVIQTMMLSQVKTLGVAAVICVIGFAGYETFGRPLAAQDNADPNANATSAAKTDRQEALRVTIDKIQGELADSVRRNIELQKSIDNLRGELDRLRKSPESQSGAAQTNVSTTESAPPQEASPTPARKGARGRTKASTTARRMMGQGGMTESKAASTEAMQSEMMSAGAGQAMGSGMPMMGKRGGMGGMMPMGRMGIGAMGGGMEMMGATAPDRLQYATNGQIIVVPSPEGDKVTAFSTEMKGRKSLRLFDSNEPKHNVVPVVQFGVAALKISGPSIKRIAVFCTDAGKWYPQDLKEAVEEATPLMTSSVVAYEFGQHIYAFSTIAKRWDLLTLPKQAQVNATIQQNTILVDHDGHLYIFSAKIGEWIDLDTRSFPEDQTIELPLPNEQ